MTVFQQTIETAAMSAEKSLNIPATEFIELVKSGAVRAYKAFSQENSQREIKAEFDPAGRLQLCQEGTGEPVAIDEAIEAAINQSVDLLLAALKGKIDQFNEEKEILERERQKHHEERRSKLRARAEALVGNIQLAKVTDKDNVFGRIELELDEDIAGEISKEEALDGDATLEMIPVMVTELLSCNDKAVMSCSRKAKEIVLWLLQELDLGGTIYAVARDPGRKSIIAIETSRSIDDLKRNKEAGITQTRKQLGGESIEFVEWDQDVHRLIANSFSPEIRLEDIITAGTEVVVIVEPVSEERAQSEAALISELADIKVIVEAGAHTENLPGLNT